SPRADDYTFLRRAFLDLIGRIPTVEEVRDFEEDRAADKRHRLIRRLLHETRYRPLNKGKPVNINGKSGAEARYLEFDYAGEFAEHYANVWTVWLMTRTGPELYRRQMRLWLTEEFRKNTPYRDLVVRILTATGKNNDNGAVNYTLAHLGTPNPEDVTASEGAYDAVPITSRTTRLFLGVQTQCTQCHDHPFNPDWQQKSFWGVNAFFRQVTRDPPPPRDNRAAEMVVEVRDDPTLNRTATVFYERRNGVVDSTEAQFLRDLGADPESGAPGKGVPVAARKSRRALLAEYVVTHDNFAKAYVNRVWGLLFGRGLNELPAVDDFGEHNPVVHPELLDGLARAFAEYNYDTKALLEWICNSDAYQLHYVALPGVNDKPEAAPYFARMGMKAMTPEQLFDSLQTALNAERDADREARAQLREAWMQKLVRNFGDDEGNEVNFNGTVIQALLMMNGPELNAELTRDSDRNPVKLAIAYGHRHGRSVAQKESITIDDLYLRALGRHVGTRPSPAFGSGRARSMSELDAIRNELEAAKKQALLTDRNAARDIASGAFHKAFFEDLFWALLNTNEFILNH
ncbi:MAG TPA: DUF1549 domain-containing protein, partial [Gemmataceae bacterium]